MFAPRAVAPPCPDAGVSFLLRGEDNALLPQRRTQAVADVCRRLDVPAEQVTLVEVRDEMGHWRITASWAPPS